MGSGGYLILEPTDTPTLSFALILSHILTHDPSKGNK
jgi:hypothetical protein